MRRRLTVLERGREGRNLCTPTRLAASSPPPSIWPSAAVAAAARLHGLSDNHSESFPPFPSLFLPQPQSHRRKEERHIFLPLLWIWNSAGSPHWSGKEGGMEAVSMMMRSMMATTTVLVAYYISDEREERGSVEVVFAIARIAAASLAFSCLLLLGAPSQRWTCFLPT